MTGWRGTHAEPIHLARELLAELFEEILTQQLLLKRVEDALLDFITSNRQATFVMRDRLERTSA
jgi:hypothetical protein